MKTTSAVVVAVAFLVMSASAASAATSDAVRDLAHRAEFDDGALEQLENVADIDGRPVDMQRLLQDAPRSSIEERVATLLSSEGVAAPTPNPDDSRRRVQEILSQRRYRPAQVPRPFRGVLKTIAGWLDPIARALRSAWDAIVNAYEALGRATPGGVATLWLLTGIGVIALAVWGARRAISTRTRAKLERSTVEVHAHDDPRRLERDAARAAARGDHESAVRLMFQAGVIRLARARAIPARSSLTTGDIRRRLALNEFDRIGKSFDEIAYGGRRATKEDSTEANSGWRDVLQKVTR
ncbi:MAG TPA: DUF4129 domain-containing protein [Actinomycetota bacterium]|nr:DUF4129 domain-containing protein [Actinomycetota bacterium]